MNIKVIAVRAEESCHKWQIVQRTVVGIDNYGDEQDKGGLRGSPI